MTDDRTGHTFVLVSRPDMQDARYAEYPLFAAEQGVKRKKKRYLPNYEIRGEDLKPLAFDTFGGYAESTYGFLRELMRTLSGEDAQLFAKLMRALRERIAFALHVGQAYVICWINAREQEYRRLQLGDEVMAEAADEEDDT